MARLGLVYARRVVSIEMPCYDKSQQDALLNTIIDKTLTYASETWAVTKRDKKQVNIFERKMYRRILGPVYDNENQNWRILNNKEIYASVKKPIIIETTRLNRLRWFGHVKRMEENRIPKKSNILIWKQRG